MRCVAIGSLMLWLAVAGATRADDSTEVSPAVEPRTPAEYKPEAKDDPPIPVAESTRPVDDAQLAKDRELLAKKVAELQALQAEIAQLRRTVRFEAQLVLKVQVVEIARTKMRSELGIDISDAIAINTTHSANRNGLAGVMQMLKRHNMLKVLAEPTLVVSDGRPGYFFSGGEVLCPITRADRSKGFEHRKVGTQVDLVANRMGGDRIFLNLRAKVSETDPVLGGSVDGLQVPGIRSREIDTALEMELGHTAIFGGGIQIDRQTVVDPKTKLESHVEDEIETLFFVTPELFVDDAK